MTAEVAPGVWSIPVALPFPGLDTVYAYALGLDDGVLLVDAGWMGEKSAASLAAGLNAVGASFRDVRGAVFTHAHGDHYGLAGALADEAGAWIALHAQELPSLERARAPQSERLDALSRWLDETGVDGADREAIIELARRFGGHRPHLPDVVLADGDRIDVPGWELTVLHTPGHSPGHICLLEGRTGIVFTGDHLLARTTPNVSVTPGGPSSPLDDYLRSLELTSMLGDRLGLAGHEEPIASLGHRSREIALHHDEQLATAAAIVSGGARTVAEVAPQMPWTRGWSSLGTTDRRLALAETHAHLLTLERRGLLESAGRRPVHWTPA